MLALPLAKRLTSPDAYAISEFYNVGDPDLIVVTVNVAVLFESWSHGAEDVMIPEESSGRTSSRVR